MIDVYVISAEASEFLLKEYFTFWSFCIFRKDILFRWNANIWHIKVCLSHNCTHFSSFFSISKTVESCSRVFQNLLVILALFSRFFIPVTIKKKKVLPVTASFYLGGFIEPPQNICSLSLQGQFQFLLAKWLQHNVVTFQLHCSGGVRKINVHFLKLSLFFTFSLSWASISYWP